MAATNSPPQQSLQLPLINALGKLGRSALGVCVNRAAVVDTRDGSLRIGVTNALWQKAFTPEWGATRRQAGGKVKRCVAVFDVLIPLNVFAYSALGQVWCMLLIQLCQTCIYANCYILVQSISQNG